ncbi:MAG: hypothetical protein Q8R02_19280 [Hyphomonadaceae bacterium]|nr:hypothetical protein [Hyphomonadaceae bacterium]
MKNRFSATTLVVVTAMGLGLSLMTSAAGQQPAADAEAIIYRDQNFQGPAP